MTFTLKIKPKAEKNLDKLPVRYRTRVIQTLRSILSNPYEGKKLLGARSEQYSVRVWPYRIIYMIEKDELIVFVIAVDHRQGVYKK